MMAGAFICLILVSILMLYPLGFTGLLLLFLAMGITTSTQVIGYPYAAENSPRLITAMSVSVVNITTQAGLFFAEPLFGYLMDLHHSGGAAYTAADFHWAMLLFPVSFALAIGAVLKLRETHCQIRKEELNPQISFPPNIP
jgi:MFS family permease